MEVPGNIYCFTGPNGAGKTNMLDAIYFLCSGKSYFNYLDQQLIKKGEDYFSLRGDIETGQATESIVCVLQRGRKKIIKRNEIPYERIIDHYGEFPAIMVAPGDIDMIMGGSEERRKWMDSTISLHDRPYLQALIQYEKIIKQRNAELKKLAAKGNAERNLLDIYDDMLEPLAQEVHAKRKVFITEFLPFFDNFQQAISGQAEKATLSYESKLENSSLKQLLTKSFRKDMALQYTSEGTHRDDLLFSIDGNPLKRYGSQGQQKTFLLALKLAQYKYIEAKKNLLPLLLLDDISERLDEKRLKQLFGLIAENGFGQTFITDTSYERIRNLIDEAGLSASFHHIEGGSLSQA